MPRQIIDSQDIETAIAAVASAGSSVEFGTGKIGDVTIDGLVEACGELHCRNLTITATGVLAALANRQLIVRVLGRLNILAGGAIHADSRGFPGLGGGVGGVGCNDFGAAGGGHYGGSPNYPMCSAAGGGGGGGGAGSDNGGVAGIGGSGGAGGHRTAIDNAGGGACGVGRVVGVDAHAVCPLSNLVKLPLIDDLARARSRWLFGAPGGSGGGGGGSSASDVNVRGPDGADGGLGGAGGGSIEIWVKEDVSIEHGARITARGGDGGPATKNGGGGGGGGGGTIVLAARGPVINNGVVDARGGAGGLGGPSGGSGTPGEDGFVLIRQVA